jgi:hypothetical protein
MLYWYVFVIPICPDRLWAHTVFYPVVTKDSFPRDEVTVAEVVHSLLFSVKIMNTCNYISTPSHILLTSFFASTLV